MSSATTIILLAAAGAEAYYAFGKLSANSQPIHNNQPNQIPNNKPNNQPTAAGLDPYAIKYFPTRPSNEVTVVKPGALFGQVLGGKTFIGW